MVETYILIFGIYPVSALLISVRVMTSRLHIGLAGCFGLIPPSYLGAVSGLIGYLTPEGPVCLRFSAPEECRRASVYKKGPRREGGSCSRVTHSVGSKTTN